jgi:2-amino-4-hydroxy-6-hydroxymethyldihydropteridine diphosphokinase
LIDYSHEVVRCSSLYESEPWGEVEGGNFINGVIEIECAESAEKCLDDLLRIEILLGRTREHRHSARTCDLDLLLWGNECRSSETLELPHPRLTQRNFVLVPLCELIPEAQHPILNITFSELLATSRDLHKVWKHHPKLQLPPL